jgi:hypothetical protein
MFAPAYVGRIRWAKPFDSLSLLSNYFSLEASPFPLSSRPKWRDLRYSGPILEMFSIDRQLQKLRSNVRY